MKQLRKWVKSWCCQAVAVRFHDDLRCKSCGQQLFNSYAVQKLIVEGESYDPDELVDPPRING